MEGISRVSKDDINIEEDCYNQSGVPRESCSICAKPFVEEPKIRCAICNNTVLCAQCFSHGLETKNHRCFHPYSIDRRHISEDPNTDWSLAEDSDLLQALQECGYGNDIDIGKRFMHRTFEETRVRADKLLGLDKAPLLACIQVYPLPAIKYQAGVVKEEPPRFSGRGFYARQFAGYSAPRGDFESEHANNAEEMLVNLGPDAEDLEEVPDELTVALTCSIVECYNSVLQERKRRKKVIKEHCLLMKRSQYLLSTLRWPKLIAFMQLMTGEEFDSLIEGLYMEERMARKFRSLRKYRYLGIKRLKGCAFYERLMLIRSGAQKDLKNVKAMVGQPSLAPVIKKAPQPLDISLYESYELLNPSERELCAMVRIVPRQFLDFKKMLVEVNAVDGGVKLKTARIMLKIDVNKTRKIFDFLKEQGHITELKPK